MSAPDHVGKPPLFGRPRAVVEAELGEREAVRCPLCDCEPERFATDCQGFHLARCPRCQLQFHSPRPPLARLAERVYACHYDDLSEAASQLTPAKRAQYARQLDRLEQLWGQRGSLLDVGCGAGAFLRYARERGWEAAGTDIQLSEGARSSRARLWCGRLTDIDFGRDRFSAVRFHHVLEHTENPLADLERARALLNPGGLLYLSVPNLDGLGPRWKSWLSRWGLKRHRWRHYAALHHLWFFTPATLRLLVERAGFEVLHWETPLSTHSPRPAWLTAVYRRLLEKPRRGSILDFYCRSR